MPEQYAARIAHPQARLFEDTQVCLVWSGRPTVGAALTFDEYMALGHVAVMVWPHYLAHDPAHAGLRQCLLEGAAGLDGGLDGGLHAGRDAGLDAGLAANPGAGPGQPAPAR